MSDASPVLVIGGRTGLGAAVVDLLDAEGVELRFTSRTVDAGADPRQLLCDVDNPESIERCVARAVEDLGRIGGLVVVAGAVEDGLLVSASPESLERVIRTNLLGSINAVRAVLPHFLEHRQGRIVLMGSASGLRGSPGQANYAASKAGLVGLARSVALEYGSRGITCNVLAAGFIDTGMIADLTDRRRREVLGLIPAGRLGQPEEIARAVRFLIDDTSGYINGSVIPVDGGYGMGQ